MPCRLCWCPPPGLFLQPRLHEESRESIPAHTHELVLLVQRTPAPETLQAARRKNWESSLLTPRDRLWTNKCLLQFAPQAEGQGGSQQGQGVSPGVRSRSHCWRDKSECMGVMPSPWTQLADGSHVHSLREGQACAKRGLRGWEKFLPIANSSSWTSQVYIAVPSSRPGKIR